MANRNRPRFVGVELYFEDLSRARQFYRDVLGLDLSDEEAGHYAKFDGGSGFICLERKGSETYPSRDKAVVFFEVPELPAIVEAIGRERFVHYEPAGNGRPPWAVLHDPEGHNVLLLQRASRAARRKTRSPVAPARQSKSQSPKYKIK
ncbi:MAG TPA: VOC family protein [Terriglobia bacterium]|nr:VOC family protein [Terriglobia bacterium]